MLPATISVWLFKRASSTSKPFIIRHLFLTNSMIYNKPTIIFKKLSKYSLISTMQNNYLLKSKQKLKIIDIIYIIIFIFNICLVIYNNLQNMLFNIFPALFPILKVNLVYFLYIMLITIFSNIMLFNHLNYNFITLN